jgi:hypothetical protein
MNQSVIPKLHYHVKAFGMHQIIIPETMWNTMATAKLELDRLYSELTCDTELKVSSIADNRIIFTDRSRIEWFACNKDCEDISGKLVSEWKDQAEESFKEERKLAREIAARLWTDLEYSHIQMDTHAAEIIANVLLNVARRQRRDLVQKLKS